MGQCSTLPSEGRSAGGTKRGENSPLRREDSTSMRQRDKYQQKQHHSKRTTLLQVQTQNAAAQPGNHMSHGDVGAAQARNPDTHKTEQPQPMEEDSPRDGVAKPPEIAVRTRCYKLNLDSEISAQSASFLGPFSDVPPPLTYSSSDDSSVNLSSTQIAIQTAQIFRGITISKDGTILSQNARATRSNRGAKNKRGEKSRQAAKIDKAKDLVEESILTGKVRVSTGTSLAKHDIISPLTRTKSSTGSRFWRSRKHYVSCNHGRIRRHEVSRTRRIQETPRSDRTPGWFSTCIESSAWGAHDTAKRRDHSPQPPKESLTEPRRRSTCIVSSLLEQGTFSWPVPEHPA